MNGYLNGNYKIKLDQLIMSSGAVIVANNTDSIDYISLAEVAAKLIKKYLHLPVALVTDSERDFGPFDKLIVSSKGPNNQRTLAGSNQNSDWYNLTRTAVYELTPWKRTLLIDADFFVQSDALLSHVQSTVDFAIAKQVHNPITGQVEVGKLASIDLTWATVMLFNQSPAAYSIFKMANHVIANYNCYAKIYNFAATPIRNDYAFSIACHLMGGYGAVDFGLRNYVLTNIDFKSQICRDGTGRAVLKYNKLSNNQIKTFVQKLSKNDLHFLNKQQLQQHVSQWQLS